MSTPVTYLSNQILYPLVQGCETKDSKVVNLSLQVLETVLYHVVHHRFSSLAINTR